MEDNKEKIKDIQQEDLEEVAVGRGRGDIHFIYDSCPNCGSEDFSIDTWIDEFSGRPYTRCHCNACGYDF